MSEPQPTTDPREPAAKAWRREPASKAEVAVNGVLAGLLLIAGFAFGGPDPMDELPAPPVTADPVRAGPLIRSHRPDCGVSRATLEALVHAPERRRPTDDDCDWGTADNREERSLAVSIALITDVQQATSGSPGTTPITGAMAEFDRDVFQRQRETLKAVNGLGDEARASYSPDHSIGGGSILVRARNAVVKVTYGGEDGFSRAQLPEKTAMDGALRAVTDVVRGLGVAVSRPPMITDLKEEVVPTRQPLKPCGTVSRDTVEKLVEDATKEDDSTGNDNAEGGGKVDTCKWETPSDGNYTYYLEVSLSAHPSVDSAKREYLKNHLEARAEEPISKDDEKYFAAIAGLGEQAYASFVEEGRPGGVVFRVRNVVATVVYSQEIIGNAPPGDSRPLTREQSVNGAYAAAKDVANALRH